MDKVECGDCYYSDCEGRVVNERCKAYKSPNPDGKVETDWLSVGLVSVLAEARRQARVETLKAVGEYLESLWSRRNYRGHFLTSMNYQDAVDILKQGKMPGGGSDD